MSTTAFKAEFFTHDVQPEYFPESVLLAGLDENSYSIKAKVWQQLLNDDLWLENNKIAIANDHVLVGRTRSKVPYSSWVGHQHAILAYTTEPYANKFFAPFSHVKGSHKVTRVLDSNTVIFRMDLENNGPYTGLFTHEFKPDRSSLCFIQSVVPEEGHSGNTRILAQCAVATIQDPDDEDSCEQIIAHNLKFLKKEGDTYVADPDSCKYVHSVGEAALFTSMEAALAEFAKGGSVKGGA